MRAKVVEGAEWVEEVDRRARGVRGRGAGRADSFNHTSGPRQFTSFCHQLCQESRTGAGLARRPPGGAGGLEPKCVQRKAVRGRTPAARAPPVRPGSRVAMYEANSQYESRQDASTAPEAAGDAGRRRRSGGRRRGEGTGSRGQPAGLRRCCAGRIAAAPPGEEGMGPGDDIPVPSPATPATPGAPGARKAANYGLIIQHGLAAL